MYNPTNDYPVMWSLPLDPMVKDTAAPMIPLEIITDDSVIDQMIALHGLSYDKLMGLYMTTSSTIDREAIRQMVRGQDWQFVRSGDEMVANVQEVGTIPDGKNKGKYGFWTWANEDAQALTIDARNLVAQGDTVLAQFLTGLVDQLNEARWDYEAQRSYFGRYGEYR